MDPVTQEDKAPEPTLEDSLAGMRKSLGLIGDHIRDLVVKQTEAKMGEKEDRGEVLANLMLSFRHLEDSSMRLGKVYQALDGGVSIYKK